MKKPKKILSSKETKKRRKKIIIIFFSIGILALLISLPLILQRDSNEKKFNTLRAKIEKYDFSKMIVLKDQNNVNVSKNKNKIKNLIINLVEKENNKLTKEEKNSISLIHVNPESEITNEARVISIQIKFGTRKKVYDFYLMRKATNKKESIEQKLSRASIERNIIILSDTKNLDLENPVDKQKVKEAIIKKINAKNKDNKLTKEEENSITIFNQNGIITHDKPLLILVSSTLIKISSLLYEGVGLKYYNFNTLRTPLIISEKIDSLKTKLNNVDKLEVIIVPKSSYTFKTKDSSSLNYIKNLIFDHINKYNKSNVLNEEEKNAFVFQPFKDSEIPFSTEGYKDIKFSFVIDKINDKDLVLSLGFQLRRD